MTWGGEAKEEGLRYQPERLQSWPLHRQGHSMPGGPVAKDMWARAGDAERPGGPPPGARLPPLFLRERTMLLIVALTAAGVTFAVAGVRAYLGLQCCGLQLSSLRR